MSKLEQVFYSAVGELTGIWVTINGERYLFSKESIIREQIAREIEERIVERGENEPWDKDINVGLKEAASIAKGEPN